MAEAEPTCVRIRGSHCGADAEACRQYALDLVGRDAQRNIVAGRALLQKLCDQAYTQACKDLESFACLVLDIDEGRCSGAWFKPADGRSCVAVAQAIEAGECGRRNKAAHANDWYAKPCALGVQSACGK